MMPFLKKLMAAVALLVTAQATHASLIVNGGFENPDIDTLSADTPNLRSGSPWGLPGNISLGLPGGSSIPGWNVEGRSSAIINNNIGSEPILAAYWAAAYEGDQYLYLNNSANNSTSIYQSLSLAGGNLYSLEFFLNGLIGTRAGYELPYLPQVIVSILDESLLPIYQKLITGESNITWTEIDVDFAIADSGVYRLVFSTPTNPDLPSGQLGNFITLDNISLTEAIIAQPEPTPGEVPAPASLLCLLTGFAALRLTSRK